MLAVAEFCDFPLDVDQGKELIVANSLPFDCKDNIDRHKAAAKMAMDNGLSLSAGNAHPYFRTPACRAELHAHLAAEAEAAQRRDGAALGVPAVHAAATPQPEEEPAEPADTVRAAAAASGSGRRGEHLRAPACDSADEPSSAAGIGAELQSVPARSATDEPSPAADAGPEQRRARAVQLGFVPLNDVPSEEFCLRDSTGARPAGSSVFGFDGTGQGRPALASISHVADWGSDSCSDVGLDASEVDVPWPPAAPPDAPGASFEALTLPAEPAGWIATASPPGLAGGAEIVPRPPPDDSWVSAPLLSREEIVPAAAIEGDWRSASSATPVQLATFAAGPSDPMAEAQAIWDALAPSGGIGDFDNPRSRVPWPVDMNHDRDWYAPAWNRSKGEAGPLRASGMVAAACTIRSCCYIGAGMANWHCTICSKDVELHRIWDHLRGPAHWSAVWQVWPDRRIPTPEELAVAPFEDRLNFSHTRGGFVLVVNLITGGEGTGPQCRIRRSCVEQCRSRHAATTTSSRLWR